MLSEKEWTSSTPAPEEADGRPRAAPSEEARRPVTSDLVWIFLREIGRVSLLTAEDEVEPAKAIEAGLFVDEKLTGSQPCRGARRPSCPCSRPRGCVRSSG